jgi:hypothetical protein
VLVVMRVSELVPLCDYMPDVRLPHAWAGLCAASKRAAAEAKSSNARDSGRVWGAWQGDEPGVMAAVLDVPHLTDLPFSPELSGRIRDVTRQVMRADG